MKKISKRVTGILDPQLFKSLDIEEGNEAYKAPRASRHFVRYARDFDSGVSGVVRRAIIIGNGVPGAENYCFGLVRALGLTKT